LKAYDSALMEVCHFCEFIFLTKKWLTSKVGIAASSGGQQLTLLPQAEANRS
jgi:hypothetical protein